MIFFDGTYRLQRSGDDSKAKKEASESTSSWRLRIIDLALSQPQVKHLRPTVIVASWEGGIFRATCAESLGRRILKDFKLEIDRVLWVEHFPDEAHAMYVACFSPREEMGSETFYSIDWRPIRSNEIDVLRAFIPEVDGLATA